MSASAESEAFRKSFDVLSKGLQCQTILYEVLPLLTQHALITDATFSDVNSSGMPLTQKVSLVMQELNTQVKTSPTAFKIILHKVLKAKLYHLYVQVDGAYKKELREATDTSASYSFLTDAQQSRKPSRDEAITNYTPHVNRNTSQDSGIGLSPQVSRELSIAEGGNTTVDGLSRDVIQMKIEEDIQDGSPLPPTPQPLFSRPLLSSPRPNDIPPSEAPLSSTPKCLTNPVTTSECRSLARMPIPSSEESREHESNLVMPTQPSVACEDDYCLSCASKQNDIFSLEDEVRSMQEMLESNDRRRRDDQCYIQKKISEIQMLYDRLKSKDEQMRKLKKALSCVERKCKELEEGHYLKAIERQAETLRKEMEQARREKAQLENELRQQFVYIEEMKEYTQKLKNVIYCEKQEKEKLRKMCVDLKEKNERLENALYLATEDTTQ